MPPLGLGYLAGVLIKNGFTVSILDCALEGFRNETKEGRYLTFGLSVPEIYARIKDYAPSLVGITCPFSVSINHALKIAEVVKQINSSIPVVLGGQHPSVLARDIMQNKNIDFIILGEGERSFLDLIIKIHEQRDESIRQIDGIAYRDSQGGICINPKTQFIEFIDELPMPAWHLYSLEKYFKIKLSHNPFTMGKRVIAMITSRGCPFHCIFCASTQFWGNRFRGRSVENILDEIHYLRDRFGVDEIQFEDDNMMWDKQRANELLDAMIRSDLKMHWCAPQGIRVDTLDDNICRKMKDSGCYEVGIGIESGNQAVLDKIIKKNLRLEKVCGAVALLKKHRIRANGFFIVGLPGERVADINETYRFARKLKLDHAYFMAASPLCGTELYEICRKNNYFTEDFSMTKSDYSFSSITTDDFSAKEVTRLMAKQLLWFNIILPLLTHPVFFFRNHLSFAFRKPLESFRYINIYIKNILAK